MKKILALCLLILMIEGCKTELIPVHTGGGPPYLFREYDNITYLHIDTLYDKVNKRSYLQIMVTPKDTIMYVTKKEYRGSYRKRMAYHKWKMKKTKN